MSNQSNNCAGKNMLKKEKEFSKPIQNSVSIILIMDATSNQKHLRLSMVFITQQILIDHHHVTGMLIQRYIQ